MSVHVCISPLKASEVVAAKRRQFPEYVIDAFNTLILQRIAKGTATFTQDEAIALILHKAEQAVVKPPTRQEIFDLGYLNVEEVYYMEGWDVRYDSPDRDQAFTPYFTFKIRDQKK